MKYTNVIDYIPLCERVSIDVNDNYYIAGVCFNGSRHYSETLTYKQLMEELPKYESVVDYFGGGELIVYKNDEIFNSVIIF